MPKASQKPYVEEYSEYKLAQEIQASIKPSIFRLLDFSQNISAGHIRKSGRRTIHFQLNRAHTEVAEISLALQHGEGSRRVIDETLDAIWSCVKILEHIRYDFGLSNEEFNNILRERITANTLKIATRARHIVETGGN